MTFRIPGKDQSQSGLYPSGAPRAVSSADFKQLNRALNVLSKPFPGHELLTFREREVLAQI